MDCYVFRFKNSGYITVSRHLRPDFTYGMTDKEIKENFDIVPVKF